MKLIFIGGPLGASRTLELGRWSRALLSICCLGLPLGLVALGYQAGQQGNARDAGGTAPGALHDGGGQQLGDAGVSEEEQAQHRLRAMTLGLAELQARLTRLDALGEQLTAMAELDEGEFDFSRPPAVGGPLPGEFSIDYAAVDLGSELERFAATVADRESQLQILASLLRSRQLQDQRWPSGLPVEKGWISSGYGRRTDPFTGRRSMHEGVDVAGRRGADVRAVAGGVVTWAGTLPDYGRMVEVTHGDGYITRYAHNQENLVQPGDMVRKGDTVALLGSSGRTTGAHVHYEVYKHGRPVDPSSYIARNHR